MLNTSSSVMIAGIPEWKALLSAYQVSFIITYSVKNFSGTLIPLVPALIADPAWHLIYMDNISLIFLRDTPENSNLIKRYSIPKEWAWNEVAVEAALKAKDYRNVTNFHITLGDAFYAKTNYQEAHRAYLRAQKLSPDNARVRQRLEVIKSHL